MSGAVVSTQSATCWTKAALQPEAMRQHTSLILPIAREAQSTPPDCIPAYTGLQAP